MKGNIESIGDVKATHEYSGGISKYNIILLVVMVKNFPITDGKPNVEIRMTENMNYDILVSKLVWAFAYTKAKGSKTRLEGFPGLDEYLIDRPLVVILQKKLAAATKLALSSKQDKGAILGTRTVTAHGTSAKWMSLKKK